jgi:hypothetical protein
MLLLLLWERLALLPAIAAYNCGPRCCPGHSAAPLPAARFAATASPGGANRITTATTVADNALHRYASRAWLLLLLLLLLV